MQFENDVFISYAHLDNAALMEGAEGWISNLHRALGVRVPQVLGREARIWRDPKLQGNDVFGDTLVERLPRVAVLVSVVSPRYVRSDWCTRELRQFWEAATEGPGVQVGSKSRVFKVIKTPVPLPEQPAEMQPLLGYEFFKTDPDTGRARELDLVYGAEVQKDFWTKVDDLAHDIADMLESLEGGNGGKAGGTGPETDKGSVYLASTTSDLSAEYESLKRDLQQHGYRVLPDRTLPLETTELEAVVGEALSGSRLSIHLTGRAYGFVPEGAEVSAAVIQNRLAAARAGEPGFQRLIWVPPDLSSDQLEARQQAFIEELRGDPALQRGADLLEVPLGDLKTVLYDILEPPRPEPKAAPAAPGEAEIRRIYMLLDARDQEQTSALEDFLFNHQFEVILPAFEGDEAEIRIDHQENLKSCDAVLVYWGAGNDLWLRGKLREIQKSAGYGRTRPWLAKAIYVAPPADPKKQRLRTHEAQVIQEPAEGFDAAALEAFVQEIRGSG